MTERYRLTDGDTDYRAISYVPVDIFAGLEHGKQYTREQLGGNRELPDVVTFEVKRFEPIDEVSE
jgi:hypothetical protein